MAYREERDPDADARESDAIQRYGRWSLQIRTRVLTGFAIGAAGAALATVGILMNLVTTGPMIFYVGAGVLVGAAIVMIGRQVGRLVVERKTPAKLRELAAGSAVSVEQLAATTDLANRL